MQLNCQYSRKSDTTRTHRDSLFSNVVSWLTCYAARWWKSEIECCTTIYGHDRFSILNPPAFCAILTTGNTSMVIAEPNPYVLCPQCVQVNFLKLDGRDGLVLICRWTDTVRCCNCGHVWTHSRDDILPIIRCGAFGLGFGYYIYLLVNVKGDRIYVGRTDRGLHDRMWDYWRLYQGWKFKYCQTQAKRPIAYSLEIVRTICETGFDGFDMILLEKGPSGGGWREKHWIFRLNALDPKVGYNRRAW